MALFSSLSFSPSMLPCRSIPRGGALGASNVSYENRPPQEPRNRSIHAFSLALSYTIFPSILINVRVFNRFDTRNLFHQKIINFLIFFLTVCIIFNKDIFLIIYHKRYFCSIIYDVLNNRFKTKENHSVYMLYLILCYDYFHRVCISCYKVLRNNYFDVSLVRFQTLKKN